METKRWRDEDAYVETGNNKKKHNFGSYFPASDNRRHECVSHFRLHKSVECSSAHSLSSQALFLKKKKKNSSLFSR